MRNCRFISESYPPYRAAPPRPLQPARRPSGAPMENVLISANGAERLPGKINLTLPAGSRLSIRTPGGGGWGKRDGSIKGGEMDQSIEEYKTLRREIFRHVDAMERNLIACITANGLAIAYGLKEPLVLLLSIAIPVYFWIQHTYYRKSVAKIATYIAIFLEGRESNLMWENRVRIVDLEEIGPQIPYIMRKYFHPYPIMLIISLLIILSKINFILALLLIYPIIMVVLRIAKKTDIPYTELRKPWIQAWEKIKLQQ